jgi:hypothetical protein
MLHFTVNIVVVETMIGYEFTFKEILLTDVLFPTPKITAKKILFKSNTFQFLLIPTTTKAVSIPTWIITKPPRRISMTKHLLGRATTTHSGLVSNKKRQHR